MVWKEPKSGLSGEFVLGLVPFQVFEASDFRILNDGFARGDYRDYVANNHPWHRPEPFLPTIFIRHKRKSESEPPQEQEQIYFEQDGGKGRERWHV